MSTQGNSNFLQGIPSPKDAFIIIVKTEWNSDIVDELERGCLNILDRAGATYEIITVPGAVEIPFTIAAYKRSGRPKADAFITLGAVIQGGTPHFDYVCKFVTEGVLQLNLTLTEPVVLGVLTLNNRVQAEERAGGIHGHKGEEAAITALKMIEVSRSL